VSAVKLAVFDIDGTLTLGDGLGTRCFFGAFDDVFGTACDRRLESYTESTDCGIAHEAALRALGRDPETGELDRFKLEYLARLEREISARQRAYRPLPGAQSILDVVAAEKGWAVAIATGNWRGAATLKLSSAGIAPPPVAACSEDGGTRCAVLTAAVRDSARIAGVSSFDRVVYVGDQPWDLRAAADCGAAFLGVGARRALLQKQGARAVDHFDDAGAFVSLLETF
jgi:phosphoglycolate phosphatase-like HAD superfamily hydrolase